MRKLSGIAIPGTLHLAPRNLRPFRSSCHQHAPTVVKRSERDFLPSFT